MPRRLRVRSLSDDELAEELREAVVAALLADDETDEHARRVDRAHREWASRHRRERVFGCTCRVCVGTWCDALEA